MGRAGVGPRLEPVRLASYLGDLFGRDDVPVHAAPSRATDLSGLPRPIVMAGSLDAFADEDIDYAQLLNHAAWRSSSTSTPACRTASRASRPVPPSPAEARKDINNWLGRPPRLIRLRCTTGGGVGAPGRPVACSGGSHVTWPHDRTAP